ncbi:MAG TPA: hypothetical protein VMY05_04510 [Acidobacteriota bacterium]|nr:hypothetical protein [Acidobacteriota bacterium]
MHKLVSLVLGVLLVGLSSVPAAATTVAEIDQIEPGRLEIVGFEITKAAEVQIEAVGLQARYGSQLTVYAWLLDSDTRETKWVMKDRFVGKQGGSTALRRAEKVKALDPGRYELYLYAGDGWYGDINIGGSKDLLDFLGDLIDGDYDDDEAYDYEDLIDDCFVRISSDEISPGDVKTFTVTGDVPDALIRYNRLGDSESIQQGFTLEKAMNLRIYSVIEHPRGYRSAVDYGWIINVDTRDKVWRMDRSGTERAGGGRKNRVFDNEIRLEKGNYALYFVTDDSHSYDDFNVNPPYDPCNWGITLLPGTDFDRSAFALVELSGDGEPLINLTRARDDDFHEQAFRLDKETDLRVYAVGEYATGSREFVDYGWIEEAASHKEVWEMTRRNTEHAGGADKNRMFDGVVTLPAGDYVAVYVTDGSHSYRDWNAAAPFDPRAWGLAVYPGPGSDGSSLKQVALDEVRGTGNVLVSLVRVRDNERVRDKFTLDKASRVRIYAIGEGERDEMFDYGWIIDDNTNREVWEMTWRNTGRAGGARKNRMFDDEVILDAGTYEVVYVTDGSHSFNDWNDTRPRDPQSWGITVSLVGESSAP